MSIPEPLSFADFTAVETALEPRALVEALRDGFREGCEMPPRYRHVWGRSAEPNAAFVLMPAWKTDGPMAVKLTSIVPGNSQRGLPSVMPIVVIFDAVTGRPATVMDGRAITLTRTGAASALASTYLSREDSHRLVMLGTGALAPYLVRAHCAVRPIEHVSIWGRNPERAAMTAALLEGIDADVEVVTAAADAVRRADIISCATLATDPILFGAWVPEGAHIDLVGSFQAQMREADDEAIAKARIFADNRESCLAESGDLIQPIQNGTITEGDIVGDLFSLARGEVAGRSNPSEITLFKSVGMALEDLVAAELVRARIAAAAH